MPHDQQAVEQTKRDSRHDEQIHRRDAVGMIADEGVPALGRRPSTPDHILGHAGLTDIDAELRSSPWMRGAPQRGFAMLISRITPRISSGTFGRPLRRLDFQHQYNRKIRAMPIMVSGFPIASAS